MEQLRAVHLRMVEAVLGGEGLDGVAELAAGGRRDGRDRGAAARRGGGSGPGGRRCRAAPLRGERARTGRSRPAGRRGRGADRDRRRRSSAPCCCWAPRRRRAEALEFLHVAAVACLTEVAVEEATAEVEQNLRGSFLEDLAVAADLDADEVAAPRGAGSGATCRGAPSRCAPSCHGSAAARVATIAGEYPGALAQHIDGAGIGRVYALLPAARRAPSDAVHRAAPGDAAAAPRHGRPVVVLRRLGRLRPRDPGGRAGARRPAPVGRRRSPRTSGPAPTGCCSASWRRTPRRSGRSTRTRSRRSSRTTTQYWTDLVGTLSPTWSSNCNMNATAAAIYAHRHTVAYRLERVQRAHGPGSAVVRGSGAAGPGLEGVPDHRASAAPLERRIEGVVPPAREVARCRYARRARADHLPHWRSSSDQARRIEHPPSWVPPDARHGSRPRQPRLLSPRPRSRART